MPPLAALLRPLALGALLAATCLAVLARIGATPASLLLALAPLLALLALPPPRRVPPALLALPFLALLLADPLLGLLGRSPLLPEALLGLLALLWAALCAPLLLAARLPPAPPASLSALLVAAGLAPALLLPDLPPALPALLSALLLALAARRSSAPPEDPPQPAAGGLPEAAAVAASAAGAGLLWVTLRATLDPSPQAGLLVGLSALLGAGAGAALSPPLRALRLLVGAGAPLLLWGGWGLLWAQSPAASPVPFVAGGFLLGVAAGVGAGRRPPPLAGLGVAAGLLLAGTWQDAPAMLPGLLAGLGALSLLLGIQASTRLAGGVLLAGAASILWFERGPAAVLGVEGRYGAAPAAAAGMQAVGGSWGARGAGVVRAPEEFLQTRGAAGGRVARGPERLEVELDGLRLASGGRAAEAEALAGHLGALLAVERPRALLLGDDLGLAAEGVLRAAPADLRIAAPLPEVVRALAGLDPALEQRWLDPAARLEPVHPEALLHLSPRADLIVEVSRAPWADAARSGLGPAHMRAAARRLGPEGIYVLCLHLRWHAPGQPEAVVRAALGAFGHVQLWLPPAGVDSLILVASAGPPDLSRLQQRFPAHEGALAGLGLRNPLAVASLAVAGPTGARAWTAVAPALAPAVGLQLPERPHLHLGGLQHHVDPPRALWAGEGEESWAELEVRQGSRRRFLAMLQDAAQGDMAEVFAAAAALSAEEDVGVAALDALIDPMLSDARAALEVARREGPASSAWQEATRHAITARSLSPHSPRPLLALARIALLQGDLEGAERELRAALAVRPGDLEALTALAQVAHLRGDRVAEEQHLRDAVRMNSRSWEASLNLGVLLLRAGRPGEAEEALRRAVALSEGAQPQPMEALVEVYLATGQPARALAEAERALQVGEGKRAYGWFVRGRALFDLERDEDAAAAFQRAVLVEPGFALARSAYGHVRLRQGRLEEAAEAFTQALEIDPDDDTTRELLRQVSLALRAQQPPSAQGG